MNRLIAIVCFIPVMVCAQVQDDFSDGDFTKNPHWTGDSLQFEVNSDKRLHLISEGTDTACLATENKQTTGTQWGFWVKLSFNTSTNNFARFYLISDKSDLAGPLQGYFIQLGGTHDSILLFRQDGTNMHRCYGFHLYRTSHSTNAIRIKIARIDSSQWEAFIDTTGGTNYQKDGGFVDSMLQISEWSGIYCKYTTSNATRFYFDDFYIGTIIHDLIPPHIKTMKCINDKELEITFSENIKKQGAENRENYFLQSVAKPPDSVFQNSSDARRVNLKFGIPFTDNRFDSLLVKRIQDLSGNYLTDTLLPFSFHRVKAFDVVIDEILADPEPLVDLPPGEFVELHNRTDIPINLENWELEFGIYTKIFPDITIPPRGFLLIVKDTTYSAYGSMVPLFTSGSSISNEGTTIVLKDSEQHVIHAVTFSPDWYRDSFKEEGGWSLEMKDVNHFCGCLENWDASRDPSGGTPGRENSIREIIPDEVVPYMKMAFILDTSAAEIGFSESMDSLSLQQKTSWILEPGNIHPEKVILLPPHFTNVRLCFKESFNPNQIYLLKTSGVISDCAGNIADSTRSIRLAIPDSISKNEVVINEILPHPNPGGARFVELYNRSEKIVDLKEVALAGCDTSDQFHEALKPVTEKSFLLFPGEYALLTAGPGQIQEQYYCPYPERILKMTSFPTLDEDSGTVVLAMKDNQMVIDRVKYEKDYHYPLLSSTDGVSLERISADRSSSDDGNWHSAAETAGFATPTYQNSQWKEPGDTDQFVALSPEIFSPDNDGRDDFLSISFKTGEAGYAAAVNIFNSQGCLIRQLFSNTLIAPMATFSWDGFTDNRTKAPMGYYILFVELVRPDGKLMHWKKVAIITGKF